MKKTFMLLALGIASNTAFAAPETGQISFYGTVYAGGTCPIEVVNPGGSVIPRVTLGNYTTKYFAAAGTATPEVAFALRVTPDATCTIPPNSTANVTFSPLHGPIGSDLYGIQRGSADGLGLAIKDRTHAKIAPGTASLDYDLYETAPTDMIFYANYESHLPTVKEGVAEAEVSFVVALP
ncbi:type 1 fimbrial protein [Pseudomonas monteilii]|uniref:Type 1 fimbrial protein n=1 Tax=Pseudomonas monteilii TaxID=76759 RepID=A0A6G6UWD4_9PSED|nr:MULTISPECIES: fimbrial protein [Pseudomonas]AVH39774.1 type 1 fimbrial protein [Pseudomonas monteilii]MBA6137876.1 type 1 fimbrial protein [Pseudomonas monteilii]MBZ3664297.1 type 1 fimbrial protein [Pseudomonas monteilii]MBZ3669493.1 type 1 fimbrial protein [Pseudomonas monteilii]MCA4076213.1 type 1 fimbrial protein [Pseudomonas kurunegalensis]